VTAAASRAKIAATVSRHSGASAYTSARPFSGISCGAIRPREPNAPPGHILRGSTTCTCPRSSPVTAATVAGSAAPASASGSSPRHTEHRPHGSAVGSSRDSWSSCMRHRDPWV